MFYVIKKIMVSFKNDNLVSNMKKTVRSGFATANHNNKKRPSKQLDIRCILNNYSIAITVSTLYPDNVPTLHFKCQTDLS